MDTQRRKQRHCSPWAIWSQLKTLHLSWCFSIRVNCLRKSIIYGYFTDSRDQVRATEIPFSIVKTRKRGDFFFHLTFLLGESVGHQNLKPQTVDVGWNLPKATTPWTAFGGTAICRSAQRSAGGVCFCLWRLCQWGRCSPMVTCCPYSLAIFTTTEYVGKCVHSILAILYHVISRFDIILRLYYMTLIYLQLRHMFCMFLPFCLYCRVYKYIAVLFVDIVCVFIAPRPHHIIILHYFLYIGCFVWYSMCAYPLKGVWGSYYTCRDNPSSPKHLMRIITLPILFLVLVLQSLVKEWEPDTEQVGLWKVASMSCFCWKPIAQFEKNGMNKYNKI